MLCLGFLLESAASVHTLRAQLRTNIYARLFRFCYRVTWATLLTFGELGSIFKVVGGPLILLILHFTFCVHDNLHDNLHDINVFQIWSFCARFLTVSAFVNLASIFIP